MNRLVAMPALAPALLSWEKHTLRTDEFQPGWLPVAWLTGLSFVFAVIMAVGLAWAYPHVPVWLLALPLARLMAFDLTTHTLPNVYTLPLLAVGLVHAWGQGMAGQALLSMGVVFALVTLLQWLYSLKTQKHISVLGGGDIKLMLALFAWMPPAFACFAIGLGCLLWLPWAWRKPHVAQPFGVAIGAGWVGCLLLKALMHL